MRGYTRVFSALNSADVRYVVVGGVAVVLQGHARLTVDLDLVVDLADEPARRAVDVLLSLGFLPRLPVDPHDFADAPRPRCRRAVAQSPATNACHVPSAAMTTR